MHCFPVEGGAEIASLKSGMEFRGKNLGLGFLGGNNPMSVSEYKRIMVE